MLKVFAEPYSGNNGQRGSQNRPGSGDNFARPASEQRRGREGMTQYYRRTGVSALGGNVRTRGIPAPIRPVNRGR